MRPLMVDPVVRVTWVAPRAMPWKFAPTAPDPTVRVPWTCQNTCDARTPPTRLMAVLANWAKVPLTYSDHAFLR